MTTPGAAITTNSEMDALGRSCLMRCRHGSGWVEAQAKAWVMAAARGGIVGVHQQDAIAMAHRGQSVQQGRG
jgi:hypothetical protein